MFFLWGIIALFTGKSQGLKKERKAPVSWNDTDPLENAVTKRIGTP